MVAAEAVGEVVVGGGVGGGVEPVTGGVEEAAVVHKGEALVGVSDHTQGHAGDSVPSTVSGLVAEFSRPDSGDSGQEPVGEAEGLVHCTRSVEGKNAEKALEGEDKYNGAHTSHMPEH